jgi:hypothetical protein
MFFDLRHDRGHLYYLVPIGVRIFATQFPSTASTDLWVVVCDTMALLHRI